MGPGAFGPRRGGRPPRGPRLGPGRPVRPRSGPAEHQLRALRRLPVRRGGLRRGVLRHQPPRGAGRRPAAAAAAGDLLGVPGTLRHRPADPSRQRHRCLRGTRLLRLRRPPHHPRGHLRLRPDRLPAERGVRTRRLRPRPGGTGGVDRHRVLVVPGGDPPGGAVAAAGRVRARPRRGSHRHGDDAGPARDVPAAGPGARRPVQGVLRHGGRRRVLRGRRGPGPGAAVGRAAQRTPRLGPDPGLGDQPGRRVQRADRAERPGAAAGDPSRAGQRPGPGERRRRGGSARHGHQAGRPDRGAGAARHLRAGPRSRPAAVAGVAEIQHRPRAGGRRRRRGHQDDHGDAAPDDAQDPARGPPQHTRGLVGRGGGTADRGHAVAQCPGPAPAGGSVRLRRQRHQRAPDPGGGPRRGDARRGRTRRQ